jgi:hypothetical protein
MRWGPPPLPPSSPNWEWQFVPGKWAPGRSLPVPPPPRLPYAAPRSLNPTREWEMAAGPAGWRQAHLVPTMMEGSECVWCACVSCWGGHPGRSQTNNPAHLKCVLVCQVQVKSGSGRRSTGEVSDPPAPHCTAPPSRTRLLEKVAVLHSSRGRFEMCL